MRYIFLSVMSLAMALAGLVSSSVVVPGHHDCADVVAGAFVHQHRPDIKATDAGVLRGRLLIEQETQFGAGAWACLAADKQVELDAAGISDDASLSASVRTHRRDYDQADRLGSLPQADGALTYVYRLSRPVRTHDLVTATGPAEWVRRNVLGRPSRPQLEEISRTESILLLVRLDQLGRVDRFGFIGDATG
jgi:S1-C subfamily serine protease